MAVNLQLKFLSMIRHLLIVATLLSFSGHSYAQGTALSCAKLFGKTNIDFGQTVTTWFSAVELGYHDKLISKDLKTGKKRLAYLEHENARDGSGAFDNIFIMPDANDGASSYFAKTSYNRKTSKVKMELHPIEDSGKLTQLTDKTLDLTWSAYQKLAVVSKAEIDTFKVSETELSPQRKVTFITTTQSGRSLAVMRVYDGSPFPASFLGGLARQHEAPLTDPRLPIERRYPHLQLREQSQYIFEAGRLAKSEDIAEMLEFQFYNLGSYFMTKFGFLGVGPRDYIEHGRIYIEITGKFLETYMKMGMRIKSSF